MVDLVPGASVVGEPGRKVALWVLEASAGNHTAVAMDYFSDLDTVDKAALRCQNYAGLYHKSS